jgi:hypothetical protein
MPNSREDTDVYFASTQFALGQFFASFVSQQRTLDAIKQELDQIEHAKQIQHDVFVNRDQWSPHANYYYGQYMQRLQALTSQSQKLGTDDEAQIHTALTRIGATEEAMAVIAGAILQLAKQVLSFRFGPKANLPASRLVGSQPLTEVIWEGRNHSMHWEENNPTSQVAAMLQTLTVDFSLTLPANANHAWTILGTIGWKTTNDILNDLKQIL